MKILLITQSYLPVLGGLQHTVHHLAQGLHVQNHEVQVLTMRYPLHLPPTEKIDDIVIHRIFWATPFANLPRLPRWDVLSYSLVTAPLRFYRLGRWQKEFVPDVIHLHFPDRFSNLALRLAQKHEARLVVSFHGNDIRSVAQASESQKKQMREVLDKADSITAVSQNLLNHVLDFHPTCASKIGVVYNSLPDALFNLAEPYQHPTPYLFAYGRLEVVKGFDLLLEAFAKIRQISTSDVALLIAGDGAEKNNLAKLSRKLNISEHVHFLGQVSVEKIKAYIRGSQFVVVPSRQESFGLTVLETMAQGRKVLTTNVGGIPEFIEPTDNLLVEPTLDDMKNGLQQWLSLPQFNPDSKKNIAHAQQFRVKQMVDHYLQIYRGIE